MIFAVNNHLMPLSFQLILQVTTRSSCFGYCMSQALQFLPSEVYIINCIKKTQRERAVTFELFCQLEFFCGHELLALFSLHHNAFERGYDFSHVFFWHLFYLLGCVLLKISIFFLNFVECIITDGLPGLAGLVYFLFFSLLFFI